VTLNAIITVCLSRDIFKTPKTCLKPLPDLELDPTDQGSCTQPYIFRKEAQLMLTNPRDAFSGQSRSPDMVPFDMLDMVSY